MKTIKLSKEEQAARKSMIENIARLHEQTLNCEAHRYHWHCIEIRLSQAIDQYERILNGKYE
jgi:hypothetical protein